MDRPRWRGSSAPSRLDDFLAAPWDGMRPCSPWPRRRSASAASARWRPVDNVDGCHPYVCWPPRGGGSDAVQ
eukprot:2636796-Rhodomonas_salina.1